MHVMIIGDGQNRRDDLEKQIRGCLAPDAEASVSHYGIAPCGEVSSGTETTPDIIVLDIALPGGGEPDCLAKLRRGADIPVLLLTAPYDGDELAERIEPLLHREGRLPETFTRGALTLDIRTMIAYLDGKDMNLKPRQFTLLLAFMENEGRVMSADYIYSAAWGAPMYENAGALKYQISSLRSKIKGSGYAITSVYGKGYRFEQSEKTEKQ